MGRPTKYPKTKKSEEKMIEKIIDHLSKGFSTESVAGLLGICKDTLYEWKKQHDNFSDAIQKGNELSRLFWEKTAVENITHTKDGKQVNTALWIFNMKNSFKWQEKPESEIAEKDNNINLNITVEK